MITQEAVDRLIVMLERHAQREGKPSGKVPALFRPSSASRWLSCLGSTQLVLRAPKEGRPSSYAREGTAAHKVAEQALLGERQPHEWTDRMVRLDGDAGMEGHFVDAEMAEAVQIYVDGVQRWYDPGDRVEMLVESRLSLAPLDPADLFLSEVAGTADHVILNYTRRRIVIRDLKYGKGVVVKATSPQPRVYGLMALVSYDPPPEGWDEIVCEITQPRLPNEDQHVTAIAYTPGQLMDFLGEIYETLLAATDPAAPLTPDPTGDYCRWCPAAAMCPALADRAMRVGQDAFSQAPLVPITAAAPVAVPPSAKAIVLPDPVQVSPADLATWLESREPIDAWFTAVEKRAAQLSLAGVTVPGWKMVPRTGRRRFKDKDAAVKALYAIGLQTADIYDTEKEAPLRTPKQVEDRFKGIRKKDVAEIVASLTERPEGEPVLVRADDKRGAVGGAFTPLVQD